MSGSGFMRLGKLTAHKLLPAAKHNRRTIPAGPSIDPSRTLHNFKLRGPDTPEEVQQLARSMMAQSGAALRIDGVACVELVFSLPITSAIDCRDYFEHCTQWAERHFACPILSSDVHLDESAPHCHVLLLPLVNGRMNGSALVGNAPKLRAHHESFHAEVGQRFGLQRAPARLSSWERGEGAAAVLDALKRRDDPAMRSELWPQLRALLEGDPLPSVLALGLDMPAPRQQRTFPQIMTGKGRATSEDRRPLSPRKPIGFETPAETEAYAL